MKLKALQTIIMLSKYFVYGVFVQVLLMNLLLAANTSAQKAVSVKEVDIAIESRNSNVKDLFKTVEKLTDFNIHYDQVELGPKLKKNISIPSGSMKVSELLIEISKQAGVKFKQVNQDVSVVNLPKEQSGEGEVISVQLFADVDISGKITDENGEGLPGASVIEKGTANGVTTDLNGNYKLSLSEEATIAISFVGYVTKELIVGSQSVIDVQMAVGAEQLEEVVVIGYGSVKKKDLSGSVSSVSGSDLEKITSSSFDKALQGRSAGVLVSQNNGAPGASPSIRIRGSGSVNSSNEPLYVIDGLLIFPNNSAVNGGGSFRVDQLTGNPTNLLATLNPNDIESIEVLKDASATAIYGSRGANGVIVVTTKRGKAGTSSFNVDWYTTVRNISKGYPLMNAGQYANSVNEYSDLIGTSRPYTDSEVQNFERSGGTNWQDEVFRNAIVNNFQLSASGGNSGAQYYVSANYFDEDGIIINNDLKRASIRANIDVLPTDKIKIGNSFTASYSINNAVPFGGRGPATGPGVVISTLAMPPVDPIFKPDGSYMVVPSRSSGATTNPVALAREQELLYRTLRTLGSFYVEYEFIEGLTGKVNLGFDISSREESSYFPQESTLLGMEQSGQARRINSTDINWLTEYLLTYNKVSGDHSFNVVGGFTMQANRLSRLFAGRENFLTDTFGTTNLGGGSVEVIPQTSLVESSLISGLGRMNYIFKDKYIVTFSGRYDGSSRFGENNKYAFFPSGAVAWKLDKEAFIDNLDIFDVLKLRASYGITGNQEIGSYRSLPRFVTVAENFGGTAAVGVAPAGNGLPNPDLTWEQTTQFDIGIDASILDRKLDVTLDYYSRETTDLLLEFPLPLESGFSSILQNSGGVKNSGIELTLGSTLQAGEIGINIDGNFSYNKNEIIDLGGPDSVIVGDQIRVIGQPLGSWYSYDVLGVWQSGEVSAADEFGRVPGDFKYRDVNGDGSYSSADRTVLGNSQPKFTYGLSSDFTYKGFELNLFFQGTGGHRINNRVRYGRAIGFNGVANSFTEVLDYWTPNNASNTVSSLTSSDPFRNTNGVTLGQYIESGNYLRLKNVSLAYNLPVSILEKLNLSKLRIYISGQNIMAFSGYSGLDPEVIGTDNFTYPFTKSYRIGLNIGL